MTWRDQAACADTDPGMFFLGYGPGRVGRISVTARARALELCAGCPVTFECLDYALSMPVAGDFGIWGGTTANQRDKMRHKKEVVIMPYIAQVYEQTTPAAPIQANPSRSG